jgi:hypothetical protein
MNSTLDFITPSELLCPGDTNFCCCGSKRIPMWGGSRRRMSGTFQAYAGFARQTPKWVDGPIRPMDALRAEWRI